MPKYCLYSIFGYEKNAGKFEFFSLIPWKILSTEPQAIWESYKELLQCAQFKQQMKKLWIKYNKNPFIYLIIAQYENGTLRDSHRFCTISYDIHFNITVEVDVAENLKDRFIEYMQKIIKEINPPGTLLHTLLSSDFQTHENENSPD